MILLLRLLFLLRRHFGAGPVLLAVGLAPLLLGLEQRRVARQLATPPQEIALRDLIARGPGPNRHVVLKDFTPAGDTCAVREKARGLTAWVPVLPRGGEPARGATAGLVRGPFRGEIFGPARVQAVIKFDNVTGEKELTTLLRQEAGFRGLVTEGGENLDARAKRLLRENYPGTDFSGCLLIEEEPTAPLPAVYHAALGLGAGLLAAGAAWSLVTFRLWLTRRPAEPARGTVPASRNRRGLEHGTEAVEDIPWAQPVGAN